MIFKFENTENYGRMQFLRVYATYYACAKVEAWKPKPYKALQLPGNSSSMYSYR